MSNDFNDIPISTPEEDLYGIVSFSKTIANSILNINDPIGTAIALNGPWGAGKSSVVNLIRKEIDNIDDSNVIVTDFKCWWYRGEDALALAFLQQLNSVLGEAYGNKIQKLIRKLGRNVLQASPVVGPLISLTSAGWLAPVMGAFLDVTKRFFPREEPLEKIFSKISKILKKNKKRFLVIIDDMDRLSAEESLAIFRLIKSVGQLSNVIYLIVFDKAFAKQAINEKLPEEGPYFLEKIIQASFDMPIPALTDLKRAALLSIGEVCGFPEKEQQLRFMNVFEDVAAPYITSPRHVSRFKNAIKMTWEAIAREVNLADFVALEILRLYEPMLFSEIKENKSLLCEGASNARNNIDYILRKMLNVVGEEHKRSSEIILRRIFPKLNNTYENNLGIDRRVCLSNHFDTYFRLSLSEETIPILLIESLIKRADDIAYVQDVFKDAARIKRRSGKTMVPVYLEEIKTHGDKIDKAKIEFLLKALFEIHDEIDFESDAGDGILGIANTSLRYHWMIRGLTKVRFNIDECNKIYLSAIETASLGWLVSFVSSARGQYQDRQASSPCLDEDYLVSENMLPLLTDIALKRIRESSVDGSLIEHKDLFFIMCSWVDFMGNDPKEARSWTDNLLNDRGALLKFVRAMTASSWSQGIGNSTSLGDRVSRRTTIARISDETPLIDTKKFRIAIEEIIKDKNSTDGEKELVKTFLLAWDRSIEDGYGMG